MSDDELHKQNERRVLERLREAGWDMAEGASTLDLASLFYDNGRMVAEVEHHYERQELLLTLTSPDGRQVTVYPVYGDSLETTLDSIVGFQDRVTPDNFQEVLGELVAACPEVYVQEGEDDEPRLLVRE
ncbi:hypothetical protein B7755_005055 [Streptomyces sp. NBS 14/10]|uniref:hypothetical protein n=1 Tax=Streptomyces sp. NBS 14/10 TaxID=1945643 RepID=UPI000B7EA817|nr:hypothetical protein [Streptomyces sp. NBS 14/10]KAK1177591.1 hypothetical protein B7755_005055 [Streptomyces sp. NBS 14/10]